MTRTCDPVAASQLLQRGGTCRAIDVREYPEFAAGHVPGAELIPLSEIPGRCRSMDPQKPILLLCKGGRRAAQAAAILETAGFSDVTVLEGGTDAWKAAGLPVEKLKKGPWSLERQVRFTAGLLVLAGLWIPPWPWLSALVGAGLVFAAVTDTCGMGMLLAKMPWNRRPAANSCGGPANCC